MPLIDGQKYACGACIKGHRSSGCQHVDRPLQLIKKKGRPPTQCNTCRELRVSSKVHSACRCAQTPTFLDSPSGGKRGSDASQADLPIDDGSRSPCQCQGGQPCFCAKKSRSARASRPTTADPTPSTSTIPVDAPPRSSCCAPPPPSDLIDDVLLPFPTSSILDTPLFAPQTAGTAACFCGPNCPCPGCSLHDPYGLKFTPMQPHKQGPPCPTSLPNQLPCLGNVDLPAIEELLKSAPLFNTEPTTSQSPGWLALKPGASSSQALDQGQSLPVATCGCSYTCHQLSCACSPSSNRDSSTQPACGIFTCGTTVS